MGCADAVLWAEAPRLPALHRYAVWVRLSSEDETYLAPRLMPQSWESACLPCLA
jgi:hypothetical protein